MRYRFAREGVKTVVGDHVFMPSSIQWEGSIPVCLNNDFRQSDVIGVATDLRREDEGWLTAEIEWASDMGLDVGTVNQTSFLTIYGNQLFRSENDAKEITNITLRSLFLTEGDPWVDQGIGRNTEQEVSSESTRTD